MKNIYRKDETFIIKKNGMPYHVTKNMKEYPALIQEYQQNPNNFEEEKIVEEKISYKSLRANEYPNFSEFIDAQVKLNSNIAPLVLEGRVQLEEYITNCLNVKAKYPKE